jgi:hypothetical protein
VTSGDLLADAVAELYSADPDEFVRRRTELVSRAREAGQQAAARRIAGLRKPTRSAWVVNQLVRSSPDLVRGLADLGDELRAAQRSLNGEAVRQLSRRRRQLVADLVRQALEVSGQNAPSAALRDEVSATLSAAVADPEVARQLAAGTLERAAHHEGFGVAGPPVLTLVPPLPEDASGGRPAVSRAAKRPGRAGTGRAAPPRRGQAAPKAPGDAEAAAAEQQRRRQDALVGAERAAAGASEAAAAATMAEQQQEETVRQLEEQLAQARVRLTSVRQEARRARARERSARQALDRHRARS